MTKRMMAVAALGAACVAGFGGSAPAAVLYDGSLGTKLNSQGWVYLPVGVASSSAGPAGTTLDTTGGDLTQAGFTRLDQTLDAAAGFTLRFDVQLLSESHANNDRAGFSVVLVTRDKTKALEIGLWANEVWVQNDSPLFTHGEGAAVDTTDAVHRYDLAVTGGAYTLSIDGVVKLSGAMRDYTAFGGTPDVYEIPNFLFLGDDTTSARGSALISRVELTAVPEPGASLLVLPAVVALVRRR